MANKRGVFKTSAKDFAELENRIRAILKEKGGRCGLRLMWNLLGNSSSLCGRADEIRSVHPLLGKPFLETLRRMYRRGEIYLIKDGKAHILELNEIRGRGEEIRPPEIKDNESKLERIPAQEKTIFALVDENLVSRIEKLEFENKNLAYLLANIDRKVDAIKNDLYGEEKQTLRFEEEKTPEKEEKTVKSFFGFFNQKK